jgi:hypothetical protein
MKYIVIILALTSAKYAKAMNKNINTKATFIYLYGCDKYCEYDIKLIKKVNKNSMCRVYILSSYKQPMLSKKYDINMQENTIKIVDDNIAGIISNCDKK